MSDSELLPADPNRGLDAEALAAEESEFDGMTYRYGMTSAAGAARLTAALAQVQWVLHCGAGRDAALATMRGAFLRLERDGHREYSDTVVRESIADALSAACEDAGVATFTDEEVGEVSLLLSLRSIEANTAGWLRGAAEHRSAGS